MIIDIVITVGIVVNYELCKQLLCTDTLPTGPSLKAACQRSVHGPD